MKSKILKELKKELKTAEIKEYFAKKEYEDTDTKDLGKYSVNYAHYTKAQGYTNGILESIDIVERSQDE